MAIKSQLMAKISKQLTSLPEKDIILAIGHILKLMKNHLSKGGTIEIRGFGSFTLHYRAQRKARNPRTGEQITTKAKYAVHFKPGKKLREGVKSHNL